MTRTADRTAEHPFVVHQDPDDDTSPIVDGPGTFHYFDLANGVHARVLDDNYPYADDFELHLLDDGGEVIPNTEQRAPNWAAVHQLLDTLEAD